MQSHVTVVDGFVCLPACCFAPANILSGQISHCSAEVRIVEETGESIHETFIIMIIKL